MRYIKITRNKQVFELSESALKSISSLKKAVKHFNGMPEDIVEKAYYSVHKRPKKKTETSKEA